MRLPLPLRAILLAAATVACDGDPASPREEVSLRTDSSAVINSTFRGVPIELTVSVSPTRIAPGDTALIRMAVRNPGGRPVTLTLPDGCLFGWDARDASGARLDGSGWICLAVLTPVTLGAGETRETTAAFTGRRLNYEPGRGAFWTPLPAGTYYVAGGFASAMSPRSPWLPVEVTAP